MTHESWGNAKLVRSLRKQVGWSQEELARRSGLSVRVVAKIEAGDGVSERTIAALVHAFNQAGVQVDAADLTCNPESAARRFLSSYAEDGPELFVRSRDMVHPRLVASIARSPRRAADVRACQGLESIDEQWRRLAIRIARTAGTLGTPSQIVAQGLTVVAWGYEHLHDPSASPTQRDWRLVLVELGFRHGLLKRVAVSVDKAFVWQPRPTRSSYRSGRSE